MVVELEKQHLGARRTDGLITPDNRSFQYIFSYLQFALTNHLRAHLLPGPFRKAWRASKALTRCKENDLPLLNQRPSAFIVETAGQPPACALLSGPEPHGERERLRAASRGPGMVAGKIPSGAIVAGSS